MADSPVTSVFLKSIPHSPGVYLFKDSRKKILYIGKALDLRNRLSSYRGAASVVYSKTAAMLKKAADVETILTGTEKEALILEASLIKKHRPNYNVILRDDKNYPYLKVTINEKWPRVLVTRQRRKDGARYFGPYSSAGAMRETLALIREMFMLRTCKGKDVRKRDRPCLNHQMGRCLAPCNDLADEDEYRQVINNIIIALEGRRQELAAELEMKMKQAAATHEYEKAGRLRDQLEALRKTLEKQVVAAAHFHDQDVFGFYRKGVAVAVSVVFVRKGLVMGHQSYFLEEPLGSDAEIITGVLEQFYTDERQVVGEILVNLMPESPKLIEEWLSDRSRQGRVRLKVPQRGNLLALTGMAESNAQQVFVDAEKKNRSNRALMAAVGKTLKIALTPRRIECLDISNIGGKQAVGSLVCFEDGEPDKKSYRHYRIRGGDTPDDYGMMREVLERRFSAVEQDLPDLLLLDGGKGQLNIAIQALRDAGVTAPLEFAAIAKEKAGGVEKIYLPGRKNPVLLPAHSPVLLFMMRIRDESHRFGISFHRRLRRKETLKSGLDRVPGIGPSRRRLLLKKFGSLKRIRAASLEELLGVEGVGPVLAQDIKDSINERT